MFRRRNVIRCHLSGQNGRAQVPRLLFRLSHTVRRTDDPQEPLPNTLAADEDIVQEWDGIEMPARNWFSSERRSITLREMKYSYPGGNRVLSLLVLESTVPRSFAGSRWENEHGENSYDLFASRGQKPAVLNAHL